MIICRCSVGDTRVKALHKHSSDLIWVIQRPCFQCGHQPRYLAAVVSHALKLYIVASPRAVRSNDEETDNAQLNQ